MSKKGKPIKTTRLFSLQLADHDGLFAPKQKRKFSYSWLKLIFYIPATLLFLSPSFKIGRGFIKDPGYALPDSVTVGQIFTLPANEDDEIVPQIGGRPLSYIDGKNPIYIGAALGPTDFEINFQFNDDDRPRLKALVEKFNHPTYPFFVKRVRVTKPTEVEIKTEVSKSDTAEKSAPTIDPKELKLLERHDGFVRMRCWKSPSVEPVGVDPLKPKRNQRLGTLTAVGQGEVLFSGPISNGENLVLVYHGGGLFTRYWGLKETRVNKGTKVTAGQTVGYIPLAPPRKETHATWQALMNVTGHASEVSRPSLLALSTRLCDSK